MRYEHTIFCFEGKVDPTADSLAESFMQSNGPVAEELDRIANGESEPLRELGGGDWELVSHSVTAIGDRTLWTLILRHEIE